MGNEFVGDGQTGFYVPASQMELALGLLRRIAIQRPSEYHWNSAADEIVEGWIGGWSVGDAVLARLARAIGHRELVALFMEGIRSAEGSWTQDELRQFVHRFRPESETTGGIDLAHARPALRQSLKFLRGRWTAPPERSLPKDWLSQLGPEDE